jgi:segregation and condensation protein B
VIKTLLEKRLITTAGRKEVIGRPILYRTSKQFMMRFGLSDLDELPSLKEFEQLAQAALGADEGIAPIEPESDALGQLDAASQPTESAIGVESTPTQELIESGDTNDLGELAEDPSEIPAASVATVTDDLSGATRGEGLEEVRGESRSSEETNQETDAPRGAAAGK